MSETSDSTKQTAPTVKRRTLVTAGTSVSPTVKLASAATAGSESAPKLRFLTPELRAKMEEEASQAQLQAEQEAARLAEEARIAQEQEAARLAEEARIAQEQEAARLAEEARIAQEQEAARLAEEARIAEEQEAIRLAEEARVAQEQEAVRVALEQSVADSNVESNDSASGEGIDEKVMKALEQVKAAQAALSAAQEEMNQQLSQFDTTQMATPAPSPVEPTPSAAPKFKTATTKLAVPAVSGAAPTSKIPAPTSIPKITGAKLATAGVKTPTAIPATQATVSPTQMGTAASTGVINQEASENLEMLQASQEKTKKRNKILMVVSGILVLGVGTVGYFAYTHNERVAVEQKRMDHLGELQEAGKQLGLKATFVAKNGVVDINPDDAKMLIDNIKGVYGNPANWKPSAHYLGMMAQLDEGIAKMVFDDLKKNSTAYTTDKFNFVISLMSAAEKPHIKSMYKDLYATLSKDKAGKKKLGGLMLYMAPSLSYDDLNWVLGVLVDQDSSKELIGAAKKSVARLIKKNPKEKEKIGGILLENLAKAPNSTKSALYELMGSTGDPRVLEVLVKESSENPKLAYVIYRGLSEWPSDNILPVMIEAWKNEKLPPQIRDQAKLTMLGVLSKDRDRKNEDMVKLYDEMLSAAKSVDDRRLLVKSMANLSNKPYAVEFLNRIKASAEANADTLGPKVDAAYEKSEDLKAQLDANPSDQELVKRSQAADREANALNTERRSELKLVTESQDTLDRIAKKGNAPKKSKK